ncbi:hypothetical protein [Herbidospora mongoliensis]|uniref:hypothetical protein n=1 Tax=Herbidospora mongoliensis TaxID=688067 RepID=UPI00082C404F|nr:hypothetical protein [Herbidospora mongoliensis]
MIATLRYEFLMQIRRPSLWIVYGLVFALLLITMPFWSLDMGLPLEGGTARQDMTTAAMILITLLPVVYGCMLADRPGRDRLLHVDGVLDATPTSGTARLLGKWAGVCLATAVPFAIAYFGRAVLWAVTEGDPAALGWAVVTFLAMIVPGLLFLGALAFAGSLVMPSIMFRVVFVAYWFWGNLIPPNTMPTLAHTIFSATGDYVRWGLLHPLPSGMVAYGEATLDVLRPAHSPATAWLWIAVMIALAAVLLSVVRLHALRRES